MFGGTRYNEVSGSYGHREFSGNENKEGACCSCSRGTPKAYRALGRRYWGNPPLRPEKVLLGNMRCRRRKSLLGNTLPGKSLLGIAIGDYWGLLGNVRKSVEHRNRYWGILFNSKILIGECPGLIGDYWGLMGYWGMCAKSLLGNVKKRGKRGHVGREIAIGECRRRLPGRREIAIGEIWVPRKYRVSPYASMVHSNQKN